MSNRTYTPPFTTRGRFLANPFILVLSSKISQTSFCHPLFLDPNIFRFPIVLDSYYFILLMPYDILFIDSNHLSLSNSLFQQYSHPFTTPSGLESTLFPHCHTLFTCPKLNLIRQCYLTHYFRSEKLKEIIKTRIDQYKKPSKQVEVQPS